MTDDAYTEKLKQRIEQLQNHLSECLESQSRPGEVDFRSMAERARDGLYHYDLNLGRFLFVNRPFCGFFGVEPGTVNQRPLKEVLAAVHPEDQEPLRQAMDASVQEGSTGGEFEYRIVQPGGGERWAQDRWIVLRGEDGRARAVEGSVRDVTDIKEADADLEASKHRALIGSYIVQDGRLVYVNPEFVRLTGYSADELVGMDPLEVVHPDYRDLVRSNAVKMLKGERSDPYEYSAVTKEGEARWAMETVTSIRYRGRRAALGYFMDITKLRNVQHNLASLGLMVGAISHSLKGTLSGLDAALYLVDTGFYRNKPARIEEGLDTAKLMVDRLSKLVHDILYYVKERELDPEETDVLEFINETAMSIATRMRGADIEFSLRYSPPLGQFEIDRELIRAGLTNILENAMEACIADESKTDHVVELAVTSEADEVLIDISDNGPGMTEEQRSKAFSVFFSSKGKRGTGLGLFITKQVITQHGGTITLESEEGKGSAFHIRLPREVKSGPGSGVAVGAGLPV